MTEDRGVGNFLRRRGGVAALLSAVVVIPCVWQRHIEAGDLGSHVYNAWLAQLVEQGKAPGVYVVTAWKNVLFDLMLFYLGKIAGLGIAEKVAVAVCVLIFFWGVFALVAAVTGKMPWALAPAIAMLAYGYVFYMGFMNFYLSIGLASVALAILWPGTKGRILWAVVLVPLILLAHPLGLLWLAGTAAYRLLWLKLEGRWRIVLPASVVAFSVGILVFFLRHPEYQADWDGQLFYMRNGADQLAIYGRRFEVLSWVTAGVWSDLRGDGCVGGGWAGQGILERAAADSGIVFCGGVRDGVCATEFAPGSQCRLDWSGGDAIDGDQRDFWIVLAGVVESAMVAGGGIWGSGDFVFRVHVSGDGGAQSAGRKCGTDYAGAAVWDASAGDGVSGCELPADVYSCGGPGVRGALFCVFEL